MAYFGIDQCKLVRAADIAGPALLFSGSGESVFLITGGADRLIVQLSGKEEGFAFPAKEAGNTYGLVIEGIEFQVDTDSKFSTNNGHLSLGALLLHADGWSITTAVRNSMGFNDARKVGLSSDVITEDHIRDVGFKKWRAVINETTGPREVFAFEATKPGPF